MSEGYRHNSGEAIGPYELEKPLGRGGFSEVWRARRTDRGTGAHPVALKVLLHSELVHDDLLDAIGNRLHEVPLSMSILWACALT